MAKIENTFVPNIHGDGFVKKVTTDSGEEYLIQNTFVPNIHGDGFVQEVKKVEPFVPNLADKICWGIICALSISLIAFGLWLTVGNVIKTLLLLNF